MKEYFFVYEGNGKRLNNSLNRAVFNDAKVTIYKIPKNYNTHLRSLLNTKARGITHLNLISDTRVPLELIPALVQEVTLDITSDSLAILSYTGLGRSYRKLEIVGIQAGANADGWEAFWEKVFAESPKLKGLCLRGDLRAPRSFPAHLEELDIRGGFVEVTKYPKTLKTLRIEIIWSPVRALPSQLEELCLHGKYLTVPSHPNLRTLKVTSEDFITDAELPKLESLHIDKRTTQERAIELLEQYPKLKEYKNACPVGARLRRALHRSIVVRFNWKETMSRFDNEFNSNWMSVLRLLLHAQIIMKKPVAFADLVHTIAEILNWGLKHVLI